MRSPQVFRVKLIVQELQKNLDEIKNTVNNKIVSEFAVGGVSGRQPPTGKSKELGLPFLAVEGQEQAAKDYLDKFDAREVVIQQPKLSGDLVLSCGEWSVRELILLEPLMVDIYTTQAESDLHGETPPASLL